MKHKILIVSLLSISFMVFSCSQDKSLTPDLAQDKVQELDSAQSQESATLSKQTQGLASKSDAELKRMMRRMNRRLADQGYDIQIAEIHFFTIGLARPSVRILQQPFRWVSGDARRAAAGDNMTFIIDDVIAGHAPSSLGFWPSPEIGSAMSTWDSDRALGKLSVLPRPSLQALT